MKIGDTTCYIKNREVLKGEIQLIKEEQIIPASYEFVGDGASIKKENTGTYEEMKAKLISTMQDTKAEAINQSVAEQEAIDALTDQTEDDITPVVADVPLL